MKIKFIISILFLFSVISCKKENETTANPAAKTGSLTIQIDHTVGDSNLILNKSVHTNVLEQNFTINKFNYFISNIKLKKEDGSFFTIPQDSSYFLIKESDTSTLSFKLNNIPVGNYQSIQFIIGVDSARSTMPAELRTGVLDVAGKAADMYWVWNTGYIFLKLQCMPIIPRGTDSSSVIPYVYHIGGFGGLNNPTLNNLRTANIDFNSTLIINNTSKLFLKADALKVLEGTTNINFISTPTVMLTPFSKNIADNYQSMFSFMKIEN